VRFRETEEDKDFWATNEHEWEDAAIEAVVGCAYEVSNVLGAGMSAP
jgi:hypothetical protein